MRWKPSPSRGLRTLVAAEAVMGACVIALAGILTSLGAPLDDAAAAGQQEGLRVVGQGESFTAAIHVLPAPTQGNLSSVRFFLQEEATGDPVEANTCGRSDCVRVKLSKPDEPDLGEEVRDALPEGEGWWRTADGFLFVRAGTHTLVVEVQTDFVYLDRIEVEVDVPAPGPPDGTASIGNTYDVYLHENPFHIAPEVVQTKQGDRLLFRVNNTGQTTHDLVVCARLEGADCVDEWARTPYLPAGALYELEFSANATGTFEYYCSVPGHREAGMRGTLEVSSPADGPGVQSPALLAPMVLLVVLAVAWQARRARRRT